MKHLFESTAADFAGITSSYEGVYHLQSYFIVYNGRAVHAIVDYFNMRGLPINHQAAISDYELGITSHLIKDGLAPFAMVSNQEMQLPLNTTYCKWSAVLQQTGIVKRQQFLKQYPARFSMTDLNIALIADKFSQNVHFIHFLNYHGIKLD
jgi:lipopolysaccharide biosynthesis protein